MLITDLCSSTIESKLLGPGQFLEHNIQNFALCVRYTCEVVRKLQVIAVVYAIAYIICTN